MSYYRRGYSVERNCAMKLRKAGFDVYRSAGSRGLADLIAINRKNNTIYLIQVKKEDAPIDLERLKNRFSGLKSLDGQYELKTFLFIKVKGRYDFIKL